MAALILSFDARSLRLRALLLFQGQTPSPYPYDGFLGASFLDTVIATIASPLP